MVSYFSCLKRPNSLEQRPADVVVAESDRLYRHFEELSVGS